MKRLLSQAALAAATAGVLATAAPVMAAPMFDAFAANPAMTGAPGTAQQSRRSYDDDRYYGQRRYNDEPVYREARSWRGDDGRTYCRRKNGTTGLIIGGAAGALLGREVDRGRDRTLGTLLGAAGGALLGREVERGRSRCR